MAVCTRAAHTIADRVTQQHYFRVSSSPTPICRISVSFPSQLYSQLTTLLTPLLHTSNNTSITTIHHFTQEAKPYAKSAWLPRGTAQLGSQSLRAKWRDDRVLSECHRQSTTEVMGGEPSLAGTCRHP